MSSDRRFLCVSVAIFIMWILERRPEANRAYVMIYDGEMKIKGKSLRAASGKVEIASEDITTGDIDGLFDGDFVLALTNPHITLKSNVKNASLEKASRLLSLITESSAPASFIIFRPSAVALLSMRMASD